MDKIEYQVIEHQLLKLYSEIQKQIPSLHRLTFEINTHEPKRTELSGFIHFGKNCDSYGSVDTLINIMSKKKAESRRREILFRKFK